MFTKRPRLAALAGALVLIAGIALWWWMGRAPSASAMLSWLPPGDGATVYVDFQLLRRIGLLDRIAGNPAAEDPEYKKFIEATGFNYRTDLDGVLLRFRNDGVLYVVSGKFDDARMRVYAEQQGGRCVNGMCSVAATSPGRQLSFVRLNGTSLAMAVSPDPMAAAMIATTNNTPSWEAPMAPVWARIPAANFGPSESLPPGMGAFLQAFRGAEHALLLMRPTKEGVDVVLEAPCRSNAGAQAVAGRLMQATALLKSLIEREGKKPEPDGLSGVLTSGQFRADGNTVRGYWPLRREFLEGSGK